MKKPLLCSEEAVTCFAEILHNEYGGKPALFVGNGSSHPSGKAVYTSLSEALQKIGFSQASGNHEASIERRLLSDGFMVKPVHHCLLTLSAIRQMFLQNIAERFDQGEKCCNKGKRLLNFLLQKLNLIRIMHSKHICFVCN